VSHDLNLLIASELRQLSLLIEPRRPLIARSMGGSVSLEDIDALSALLHSAYTAMERIMTHAAKKEGIHEELRSKAFMWHTALLNILAASDGNRPAVISKELRAHLNEYLGFRHVFRHAYIAGIAVEQNAPACGESGERHCFVPIRDQRLSS